MTRKLIVFAVVAAALVTITTISASAQTAGATLLEQVSLILKDSYAFGFSNEGTSLTLRNELTGKAGVTLGLDHEFVVMQSYIGNLSDLSNADRKVAREKIAFMNTHLPVGTLVVEGSGDVLLKHHLSRAWSQVASIANIVNRFAAETDQRRAELFG